MTVWSHGYVADSPYTFSYQPAQAPGHLAMVCAMAGVVWAPQPRMAMLDIGCGRGLTVNVLAAANPGWHVLGLDYNPAHIAEAQELADAAGCANAGFCEADLAEMTDAEMDRLPELDIVTIHGVWTWVADAVRDGIVRLLARRLKPGGLCYIGYNVQPAFGADAALQRLFMHLAGQARGSSRARVEAALEQVRALAATNPAQLPSTPMLRYLLDKEQRLDTAYLAHEFLTAHWRPAFHEDVCAALAPAKLEFVGSATLHENMPDLQLDAAQRATHDGMPPGPAREFIKDLCLPRAFRRDVFIRGLRRTDHVEALDRLVIAACRALPEESPKLSVPVGEAELVPAMWQPIAAALREGPQSLHRLRHLPEERRPNPAELLAVLQGTGFVVPVLREPQVTEEAQRFNRALFAATLASGDREGQFALASSAIAGGLPCAWLEMALAVQPDILDAPPETLAARLLPHLDGEGQAEAATFITRIRAERIPVWRGLGLLPG